MNKKERQIRAVYGLLEGSLSLMHLDDKVTPTFPVEMLVYEALRALRQINDSEGDKIAREALVRDF